MNELTVLHKESEGQGKFYIAPTKAADEHRAAIMYHRWDERQKINIDHTEVDEALQNQGVGLQMLRALIDWARTEKIRVSSTCPYAVAMIEKHEDLQDLAVPYRAEGKSEA